MKNYTFRIVLVSIFLASFMCIKVFSQNPGWLWARGFSQNTTNSCIASDKEGNIYIGDSNDSIFVVKYDSIGNVIWKTGESGGANGDVCAGIAVDGNDNSYITGMCEDNTIIFGTDTIVSSTPGSGNIFLAKYNASGNVVWAKVIDGGYEDKGNGVAVDKNGDVYITGYFESPYIAFGSTMLYNGSNRKNAFLAKFDSNGNAIWAKGGNGYQYDESNSVAIDNSGAAYITGYFDSPSVFFGTDTLYANNLGVFLAKYDSSGNVVWAQSPKSDYASATSLSISSNRYLYVTGYFENSISFGNDSIISSGSRNDFLAKCDLNGNNIWLTGGGQYWATSAVATDDGGNAYITGSYYQAPLSWGGDTLSVFNGLRDAYLIKIDSSGQVIGITGIGGTSFDLGSGVTVYGNSSVYMTGRFESASLVFGTDTLLSNVSGYETYLARISAQATGIKNYVDNNKTHVFVYPNPFSNYANVQIQQVFSVKGKYVFHLYDMLGNEVKTKETGQNIFRIYKGDLSPGIYFYRIDGNNKAIVSGKIVITE